MRLGRRAAACVLAASGLAFGIVTASPGAAVAAPTGYGGTHTCTGTQNSPGELSGVYLNVVIDGWCNVDDGPVLVIGNLAVGQNATLNADFGLDNSRFTVDGNLLVGKNASVLMGCDSIFVTVWGETAPITVPSFPCFDDPDQNAPTLSSHDVIRGNLIANQPLGVVLNNDTVDGNFIETGGGGGLSCTPIPTTVFDADVLFPVYSTLADVSVGGNVLVNTLTSCFWGMFRVKVGRSVVNTNMSFGDPDAMEDATNVIRGNFVCLNDSPAVQFGDSDGQPNKVGGLAIGQCAFGVTAPNPAPEAGVIGVTPVQQPISVPLY